MTPTMALPSSESVVRRILLLVSMGLASLAASSSPSTDGLGLNPSPRYMATVEPAQTSASVTPSSIAPHWVYDSAQRELKTVLRILNELEADLLRSPEVLAYVDVVHSILPVEPDTPTPDAWQQLTRCLLAARIRLVDDATSYSTWLRLANLIAPETSHEVPSRLAHLATSTRLDPLLRAIEAEPFEDGMDHPAEPLLAEFLEQVGESSLSDVIANAQPKNLSTVAVLLRLVGRSRLVTPKTRVALVKVALASPSIEVRDAAVNAAENWEDPNLAPVLRQHQENVPWLAKYVSDVARDIAG